MKEEIRYIQGKEIIRSVSSLYTKACTHPDPEVEKLLRKAYEKEDPGPGKEAIHLELQNFNTARETGLPICQDTGTAIVFAAIGNLVCIPDGSLQELVDRGVSEATKSSFLRSSQVSPPVNGRLNSGDNSPAVLHVEHTLGNKLVLSLLAKGAGCENVSRSEMLPPLSGEDGILALAEECVLKGASRACAPVFLGVGIGGSLELSGILAKRALLRKTGIVNPDPHLSSLEKRITGKLNLSGIGPQGFGGACTVLETRILSRPCHMASLPVTVCVECHAHRTASCEI